VDFTKSLIGVAGNDRTVFVYDPRKWSVKGSWSSCVKYEATSFLFSSTDESSCIVSGALDSEVRSPCPLERRIERKPFFSSFFVLTQIAFGKWHKDGNSTYRRYDGRILGIARVSAQVSLLIKFLLLYRFSSSFFQRPRRMRWWH